MARTSIASRNAQANAHCALMNNGYFRVYSGTRPATVDTALSGNTLLAELRFGAAAFGNASGGVATANAVTQDSSADAAGTMSFVRCFASDGTTAVMDMSIGTTGTEVIVPSTTCVQGLPFACSSMTYTQPDGT